MNTFSQPCVIRDWLLLNRPQPRAPCQPGASTAQQFFFSALCHPWLIFAQQTTARSFYCPAIPCLSLVPSVTDFCSADRSPERHARPGLRLPNNSFFLLSPVPSVTDFCSTERSPERHSRPGLLAPSNHFFQPCAIRDWLVFSRAQSGASCSHAASTASEHLFSALCHPWLTSAQQSAVQSIIPARGCSKGKIYVCPTKAKFTSAQAKVKFTIAQAKAKFTSVQAKAKFTSAQSRRFESIGSDAIAADWEPVSIN